MIALRFLLAHWRVIAVLAALGAAVGGLWLWHAGEVAHARKEGRRDGLEAARVAHEKQAAENRRASAALNARLAEKDAENEKLRKQVRAALDSPDAVVYGPRGLCLMAKARGYPCQPAGSVPGEVPGPSSKPLRGGPHGAGRHDGGGSP